MASSLYEMRRLQFVVLLASLSLSLYTSARHDPAARGLCTADCQPDELEAV